MVLYMLTVISGICGIVHTYSDQWYCTCIQWSVALVVLYMLTVISGIVHAYSGQWHLWYCTYLQ